MSKFDAEPAIGDALRSLREASGKSQSEVASAAEVSQPVLSLYESGARTPSFKAANRLTRSYGVSLACLVDSSELENAKRAIREGGTTHAKEES